MAETPLQRQDDHGTGCLDAALLASYIDGRATSAERTTVEAHLARCEDCYFMFSETLREQAQAGGATKKSELARWVPKVAAGLAAAAALVIAVAVGTSYYSPPSSTLVVALSELDAASGPYRRFEPRVTALPTYRPLVPATRSAAQSAEITPALREAAARVEKAAASGTGVQDKRALAAAYLAQGQSSSASDVLTPLAASANEAGLLNDIAAAYLSLGAGGDVEQALQLLERAATLEPGRAEVWFNLGLAAEKTEHTSRAAEAWKRYLELDPSSGWAEDARRHLDNLKR
jgi:tetratricopeptide (TPR) repeat protein